VLLKLNNQFRWQNPSCQRIVGVLIGFLEKEIRKDGIPMLDTGENPDAPAPREMIDLEVCPMSILYCIYRVGQKMAQNFICQ